MEQKGGAVRPKNQVLLTGATGFVGGELLARLLDRDERPIVCLVRARSDAGARERGADALRVALRRAPDAGEMRRITWIAGDVERPRLGLDDERLGELAGRVGEIFHCAASTKFDLPLDQAERVNVGGTREVLAFARVAASTGHFRRLHHVSTAFAAGRRRGRVLAGDLPPDRPRHFRNTYEQTKARAERVLREQREIPVTIYRPSIIVGDSRDGVTRNWNVLYYPMRLVASGRLAIAPSGRRALLDCVPVDFVVDGIVALAKREDTAGAILHLVAGTEATSVPAVLRELCAGVERSAHHPNPVATRIVGPARWWIASQGHRWLGGRRARQILTKFSQYAPYTRIDGWFDSDRERELLAAMGVTLAPCSHFLPRVVDYALAADFGRTPERAEIAAAPEAARIAVG
jgi:thioester reductase-like protein